MFLSLFSVFVWVPLKRCSAEENCGEREREMEELKKLEEVQRMIALMESHGFVPSSSSSSASHSNNNEDSSRFLANLILLLTRPCGDFDIDDKCRLIRDHLPRLSRPFLEEASLLFHKQENQQSCVGKVLPLINNFKDIDVGVIGLEAMQRANSTLEDFCRSYFMFHGIDTNKPQSIFKYLPLLSFTESYIYQMDRLNEQIINMPTSGVTDMERLYEEGNRNTKFIDLLKADPFRPLVGQLECLGLLTERIREEFRAGKEYWTLERKLCSALMNQKEISVEEVMRAIHLKSFDYRVLNLLLYQLRGANVNDLHMQFLSVSEFLVEVSDDLFDYEDDVLENNFNILRMFVRIYGPSAAPVMLAKHIGDAEEKYDSLLRTLDPQLSLNYRKRCEEATKEGGNISGHSLGAWSIPPVIGDEESYRSRCQGTIT